MSEPLAPLEPATLPVLPRLDALDILRGAAILGILLMNTQSMGLPSGAYFNPTAYGDYTGANRIVWMIIHIVADLKFVTTFSILFGAGILLQGQRVATRGMSAAGVHYRRMVILLLFGIFHAYILWYGDVLIPYAICGMILFPFRRLPAPLLAFLGVLFIGMVFFIRFSIDHQLFGITNALGDWSNQLLSNRLSNDFELTAYRGGWVDEMSSRAYVSLDNNGPSFLIWSFWRYGGSILIGMALLQTRFFHADWPRAAYAFLAGFCIPFGWSITGVGIVYNELNGWDPSLVFPFGEQFNYWGSLIAALGYISLGVLVSLAIRNISNPFERLLRLLVIPIRSVGRLALSNYIADTLIGTTIFYGRGFGQFGHFSRVQLLQLAVSVWIVQLTVSTIYLQFFKQGPLEWLWHRLVYGATRSSSPAISPTTS